MAIEYYVYAVTELFLIIFSVIVLVSLNGSGSIGTEYETKIMRRIIFSYFLLIFCDMIWAFEKGREIDFSDNASTILNSVYWCSLTIGCYFWFLFVEARLRPTFVYSKKLKLLIDAPIIITVVIILSSIFTHANTYVRGGAEYCGPIFNITMIVDYLYLIIPAIDSIYNAIKARVKQQKKENIIYGLCMTIPVAAGVIENYTPMAPVAPLSIFMVILVLFFAIQNGQINNDALTGLNNRRKMDQYLEDRLINASEKRRIAVFIMDINNFKNINDTYGHVEGDNALREFAAVLKKSADRYNAFAARYGGDEFCLIISLSAETPDEIAKGVHDILRDEQTKRSMKNELYELSVSIGYAVCTDEKTSAEALVKIADKMLYDQKQKWYEARE